MRRKNLALPNLSVKTLFEIHILFGANHHENLFELRSGSDYLFKDDFSYEARRSSNQDGLACVKLIESKTFSFLLRLVLI